MRPQRKRTRQMKFAIAYLNEKKIAFCVREKDGAETFAGLKFEKVGKFIRANGKIISTNMYRHIQKFI